MIRKILKALFIFLISILLIVLIYGFIKYPQAKKENHFIASRIVNASKNNVWKVISDVGNYHKVTASGIQNVTILEGKGLGLKRVCTDPNGNYWEEKCTIWEKGNRFEFVVNTKKENYKLHFDTLSASWKLDSLAPNKTKITIVMKYKLSNPFVGGLFLYLGNKLAKKDTEILFDNWQKMVEH